MPENLPLVERYRTSFELFQSRRPMPENLRRIHENLPQFYQLIQTHADATSGSQQVAQQTIVAHNRRQASIPSALEAIRMCRESHQAFFDAVNKYNQEIADYALAVSPLGQPPERVAGMLIKIRDPNVQPTSALLTENQLMALAQPNVFSLPGLSVGDRSLPKNDPCSF